MRLARWLVMASSFALMLGGCEGDDASDDDGEGAGYTEAVSTSVCASGVRWVGGDEESPLMHPGGDCIGCHGAAGEGPQLTAAGTVYASLDAADDCFGVAGAVVEILDADGVLHAATSNDAGNFQLGEAIATPYTARVVFEGGSSEMLSPQTEPNCASCHTAAGADGAPGRVTVP